jgi:hypothetical protein
MSAPSPAKVATPKRIHPIFQLPERFQNLSVQFGNEPQLTEIDTKTGISETDRIPENVAAAMRQHKSAITDPERTCNLNLRRPEHRSGTPDIGTATNSLSLPHATKDEPPFRLYDLVKLDPDLFWQLYHAKAYNDLLIVLAYERFLPEEKKGKTNYIETVHLTGTSFEPAKSNGLEFWHAVEDGTDNGLVELKPDPDNTHDANAIRVLTTSTKKQIGWIPAKDQINQLVSRNYKLGCFNSAQLLKVEPNAGKSATIGIQIAIGWTFPSEVLQKYA